MKLIYTIIATVAFSSFTFADENHEIIEKVMKEGLKGKTSPLKKVLGGEASDEEVKSFAELVATLKGTKAPVGDQKAYEEKIGALIASAEAVAGGSKDEPSMKTLKEASNCKACHKEHKPD